MLAMRSCLALAALVGGGYFLFDGDDAVSPVSSRSGSAPPRTATVAMVRAPRAPSLVVEPAIEDEIEDKIEEPMRGHAIIEDPAELAFVFSVDGVSYVRLSYDERATSRGEATLTEEGGVYAVVAPVTARAMPRHLRAWSGRSVLVDGVCRARVVGFAEVSRVSGDPSEPWDDDGDNHRETWTVDSVTEANVVLAAKLDGCSGTWARSEDYSPAAIVAKIDAPGLEDAARADLLARVDGDLTQDSWKEAGGTGDWRDAGEIVASVYRHPLTDEQWIFVQARKYGSCGDPGFAVMAAYRANDDGTVRRVADLTFGYDAIREVVDLDGDGQPELFLGDGGDSSELVDLANESHESISVAHHSYGCGC